MGRSFDFWTGNYRNRFEPHNPFYKNDYERDLFTYDLQGQLLEPFHKIEHDFIQTFRKEPNLEFIKLTETSLIFYKTSKTRRC